MSLAVDGYSLQSRPDLWFDIIEGKNDLPTPRGSDSIVPFLTGRHQEVRLADTRHLVLNGRIATTSAAFRAYLDAIKQRLDPSIDRPVLVSDDFEDGTVRYISAVPRNLVWTHLAPGKALFSIELEALDPYWYAPWGSLAMDAGYLADGGHSLDDSAEIVWRPGQPVPIAIDTIGTADVRRILVRFVGPSTGPVGLSTAGLSPIGFVMASALASSSALVVDVAAGTVLLDGISVRQNMTLLGGNRNGEYLRLGAGPNELFVAGAPSELHLQFSVTYQ